MFLLEGKVVWSASDLAAATECEFRVARALDVKLGRAVAAPEPPDPLEERIATLGTAHEERLLAAYRERGAVAEVDRLARPLTVERLADLHGRSIQQLTGSSVVYQPGFFDGEFFGYADFVEPSPEGWVVADAKLARSAKPKAMLQVAAYADQLERAGVTVAPYGALLLGDGRRLPVPLRDVLPVFRAQRERLRTIIAERLGATGPLDWGDDSLTICGRCAECAAAIEEHDDLLRVAGLRRDQRVKLHEWGLQTIHDLAATPQVPGLSEGEPVLDPSTYGRLHAQAAIQVEDGPVHHQPWSTGIPASLPKPSPGDIFFDFEGDPLYAEGDPARSGLEYLWGMRYATGAKGDGRFEPLWAHTFAEERTAFETFMQTVVARRDEHPDLHVYHYAPYETTALKRLAGRYGTCEKELDDLLRDGVFVDLYATVRRSVLVSQPSYSIKQLEPLYMGDELREGDVQKGDVSIAEYHLYRLDVERGDKESAATRLKELADYNAYDCLSTQRLRDWLIDVAGVPIGIPAAEEPERPEPSALAVARARLETELTARAARTADPVAAQAWSLLWAAVGYHRREDLPFWWDHFARLKADAHEWARYRDVFVVDTATVVHPWAMAGRQRSPRRTLRLEGAWTPGSATPESAYLLYARPAPPAARLEDDWAWAWPSGSARVSIPDPDDPDVVEVEETCAPGAEFDQLPAALVPTSVPSRHVEESLHRYAERALATPHEPSDPAWDLLTRRPPRLVGGAPLPPLGDDVVGTVTSATTRLDRSYLAIQGPPGSGKSWTAAQVIGRLVTEHHWNVGVVAQSHAVVEHLLDAVVEHGTDPTLVGKSAARTTQPAWVEVGDSGQQRAAWVAAHDDAGHGCVLGGTAWTFSAPALADTFDLLVIDEAGQFSLANTVAVSPAARNLLLLGDPQQLPQVSQGTHPLPVGRSALGWLMGEHHTLPADLGYFLPTSHRMCAQVCGPVSALSYDGRLVSSAPERHLAGVEPGIRVIEVEHSGNTTCSPEEAEAVASEVDRLLGTLWTEDGVTRPLGEQDILVVAPYNLQVAEVHRALAARGHKRVRVGTVDKFQGQQAPVTIVSLAASSPKGAPRGMGFLLNRNRLNVAVSRAQWLSVVVHSVELPRYLPRSVRGLTELGGFLGLVGAADRTPAHPSTAHGTAAGRPAAHGTSAGLTAAHGPAAHLATARLTETGRRA